MTEPENHLEELMEHLNHIEKTTHEINGIYLSNQDNKDTYKADTWTSEAAQFLKSFLYYDSGYGTMQLFGYILYTDGTWSDRGEYDGSEWWQWQARPNLGELR